MKQMLLLCTITGCFFNAVSQDALPVPVQHFNGNFVIDKESESGYYGIVSPVMYNAYMATLYNTGKVKVAEVIYSGRDLVRKQGVIKGYFSSGKLQFQSTYKKNSFDGAWQSWYPNGRLCDEGRMVDNIPEGTWRCWYPDGQLRMEVKFDANRYWNIENELMRYENEVRGQTGLFELYRQLQTSIRPPRIIRYGSYMDLKTRVDRNTIEKHEDYLPPFTAGVAHGIFRSWFPDGSLQDSGYYNDGLKDGVWQEFNMPGNIRSLGFYKNSTKVGEWRYYNPHNRLLYVIRYDRNGREKEKIMLD